MLERDVRDCFDLDNFPDNRMYVKHIYHWLRTHSDPETRRITITYKGMADAMHHFCSTQTISFGMEWLVQAGWLKRSKSGKSRAFTWQVCHYEYGEARVAQWKSQQLNAEDALREVDIILGITDTPPARHVDRQLRLEGL